MTDNEKMSKAFFKYLTSDERFKDAKSPHPELAGFEEGAKAAYKLEEEIARLRVENAQLLGLLEECAQAISSTTYYSLSKRICQALVEKEKNNDKA